MVVVFRYQVIVFVLLRGVRRLQQLVNVHQIGSDRIQYVLAQQIVLQEYLPA